MCLGGGVLVMPLTSWSQSLLSYDVHFAVVTSNPSAIPVSTEAKAREYVDVLNANFVTMNREPIVQFNFKSIRSHSSIANSTCDLVRHGDEAYNGDAWAERFNACADPAVRDRQAINVYIFDAYDAVQGAAFQNSHGRRNSNRPYIVIDWARLISMYQRPLEHEMGHAFGLSHVCVPGATISTPTNIMASAECELGSGGLRNIGFDPSQVNTINYYAPLIKNRLTSGT